MCCDTCSSCPLISDAAIFVYQRVLGVCSPANNVFPAHLRGYQIQCESLLASLLFVGRCGCNLARKLRHPWFMDVLYFLNYSSSSCKCPLMVIIFHFEIAKRGNGYISDGAVYNPILQKIYIFLKNWEEIGQVSISITARVEHLCTNLRIVPEMASTPVLLAAYPCIHAYPRRAFSCSCFSNYSWTSWGSRL